MALGGARPTDRPFHVRFPADLWAATVGALLERTDVETKAFLLASAFAGEGADVLVARELAVVPDGAYEERSPVIVQIDRSFVRGLLVRCAEEGLSLLEIHTHPWGGDARFSHVDMDSDPRKFRATEGMLPPFRHATLVLGRDLSLDGHLWDPRDHALQPLTRACVAGLPPLAVARGERPGFARGDAERFDRQIRLFGEDGQRAMAALRVGVVGCGGLGSQVVQALAHLGVRDLALVDPDRLEPSNANRVVGATRDDHRRRRPKTSVLAEGVRRVAPEARVVALVGRAQDAEVWPALAERDLLVAGVDSPSARQFLNRLASAFAIPYVDAGVGVHAEGGRLSAMGGQVQAFVPGATACRACLGRDVEGTRVEQLTEDQREASTRRGYVRGADVPDPQVAFLNGVAANLAVWEVVKLATGVDAPFGFRHLDLLDGRLFEPGGVGRDPECLVCSPTGWLASGPAGIAALSERWETAAVAPPPRPRDDAPGVSA